MIVVKPAQRYANQEGDKMFVKVARLRCRSWLKYASEAQEFSILNILAQLDGLAVSLGMQEPQTFEEFMKKLEPHIGVPLK